VNIANPAGAGGAEHPERALILAPQGRDAPIAAGILREVGIGSDIAESLSGLLQAMRRGAEIAIVTEEAIRTADLKPLSDWIHDQPPWADFPFVLLTERGGGIERNPSAGRLMQTLGNVTFLERPFHPTTLVSVVRTAMRGRHRQYEARDRLEALHESELHARSAEAELRRFNETLEARVAERTSELGAANRQLMGQIEEREKVEATLRQMQRLEAVGQLTSGVAHDFNNLLTVILGNVGFLERELPAAGIDGKCMRRLNFMRTAAERGAKLTAQLLAFSRRQRLEPKPLDLNESLDGMRDLLQSTLGGSVQVNTVLRPGLWPALVDPTQIELVVLNLAINARDAMEVGGRLTIETANARIAVQDRPEHPAPGEYVTIRVADTGSGMTPEVRAKVFEPFFTTKDVGKGSGLGLSQVLGFAKQSGGGVRIETQLGEGTSVIVYLPRAQHVEIGPTVLPVGAQHNPYTRGAVVLLVDDDNAVREVTASMLCDLGCVVREVGSGGAALDHLERHEDIDLAVLDFAMPGMNGGDLARQIHAKWPAMPILFVTGFADITALGDVGEDRIIKKPFVDDELAVKVRSVLADHKRVAGNVVQLRR
jgi:signal transduction histidine kinase/ActR/RegA family two-component response regulator